MLTYGVLLYLTLWGGQEVPSEKSAIDVCTVLQDVGKYRDRIITIRGVYRDGLFQECPKPLVTSWKKWPSAIDLADAQFAADGGYLVNFATEQEAWARLDEVAKREARRGRKCSIWITVRGQLRAPQSYILPDGNVVGGYGHGGAYPAEFVMQRIVAIEVRAVPAYDYSFYLKQHK